MITYLEGARKALLLKIKRRNESLDTAKTELVELDELLAKLRQQQSPARGS